VRAHLPHRLRPLVVAGLLAIAAAGAAQLSGLLAPLEAQTVDARFGLRPARPAPEVVVVAVDDATFNRLGRQWPFPRSLFARATDRLRRAGARLVVFDVQFTEPTRPREDLALYDALGRARGAVLATSESDGRGRTMVLGGDENLRRIGARAAAANLPDEHAGVVRRMFRAVNGLETMAVVTAARLGRPVPDGAFGADGTAWIDFRGPPGTFRTVSFADVVQGRVAPATFAGKVVVLGASAATLQDLHPTPTAPAGLMSGPEVQANAITTALDGLPLRDAPALLDALAIVLLGLSVPLLTLRLGPIGAALCAPVVLAAALVGAQVAFAHGLVVAVVGPLLGLAVGALTSTAASFALESRERRRIAHDNERLEERVRERTAELAAAQLEVVHRLGQAVDSRDEETGEHVGRIATLAERLALAAGLPAHEAEQLGRASAMHDVGKVATPDRILGKPGPLDPAERAIMQEHTTAGAKILEGSRQPLIQLAEVIARSHHERWDGGGYPLGLAGEAIPLAGRVVAVCDVFDALVSRRPYKEPWTVADALAEVEAQAGRHFDPRLARLFVALMQDEAEAEAEAERARAAAPVPA
jgi:CHASE2 domain-containing sensor protein